jgi:hypothetical protein
MVYEKTWEIKQAGEPGHHENDVQGFDPEHPIFLFRPVRQSIERQDASRGSSIDNRGIKILCKGFSYEWTISCFRRQ